MKFKAIALFLFFILLSTAVADDKPPQETNIAYEMEMVVPPEDRLTSKWAFVVDTSASIIRFNLFDGLLKAFVTATSYPTDELRFCLYAFNDRHCWSFREWDDLPAKEDEYGLETPEWKAIVAWLHANTGTMSYGSGAIDAALKQQIDKLTVIIISDGGFSEDGEAVKQTIRAAQDWRVANGYGEAMIVSIGIENMACRPRYPKPSNETCQGWMRSIGREGKGGYFYVYRGMSPLDSSSKGD